MIRAGQCVLVLGLLLSQVPGRLRAEQAPVMVTDFAGTTIHSVNVSPGSDTRMELDALNLAAKLKPLVAGQEDEVRVWVTWANFTVGTVGYDTEGTVLNARSGKRCRMIYRVGTEGAVGATCRALPMSAQRKSALLGLGDLSTLFGKSIDCRVFDGAWMTVEGVYAGNLFVIEANNPDACKGPEAIAIAKWLNLATTR